MSRRRGLSLIETIVSVFLVGMIVLFVFNLFPTALTSVGQQEQHLQGDALAGSVLDEKRLVPFADLVIGNSETLAVIEREGISYTPTFEVFRIPGSDARFLKGLRVTVDWEYRGKAQSLVRETWINHVSR